jgi:hypothetical protein
MKAGLILLRIISAVLMLATTVYAHEGAAHNAVAVIKDAKAILCGLATFTEDTSGLVHINVNVIGLMTPGLRHPHP